LIGEQKTVETLVYTN